MHTAIGVGAQEAYVAPDESCFLVVAMATMLFSCFFCLSFSFNCRV